MVNAKRRSWYRMPLHELMPLLEEWLMRHFPTPFPVRVDYTSKVIMLGSTECDAICNRRKKKLYIKIHKYSCRTCMVDTLIHEWAHAHTWGHAQMECRRDEHDDVFYLAFGRIQRRLYDEGGKLEVENGE
jgi:hypothetical protein